MTPTRRPPQKRATTFRELRLRAGLTQLQVATAVGTRENRVSQWERGRVQPSFSHLRPLRDAFGCSWEELISAIEEARQERWVTAPHFLLQRG